MQKTRSIQRGSRFNPYFHQSRFVKRSSKIFCRSPARNSRMEMKKVACAVLFAAASMSAVMATEVEAPAQAPTSGAFSSLPALGSLVGASIVSFVAFYIH
ncbi:Arabinogalactan protein 23 [Turnera subulata]|uniref:Arabinogalactan protein 23 n=1 Tax=Turnera subulata TaxID=218843 RepID=A0A9Q0FCU5_9ROSI|nr:Arabinogalactan protein 23 [Turnera subulata]